MIQIEHKYLALMMEAGYIYLGMQRFKESRDVFEGVASLSPLSEVPQVALGSVSFCQGKFTDAIKHYKKALKLDPASVYAKAYMGEALFFMGKKAEAVKLFEEVDKEDPKGKAGDFVRALLDAIKKGYTPRALSGVDEIKELVKSKEKGKR